MRPWLLLLLPLLVSDPSLLGDGDRVMENYSWSLDRKLLLNGRMSPRGLEILQIQTGHNCMCIQRHRVYVAVQHKQRTSPFHWMYTVHDDHGCSLSHEEFTGIIHWNHIPALVVFLLHEEGKSVTAILEKFDSPPALLVISEITPTKAGGHIGIDIIKNRPDSGSAWLIHHHTAASGHSFKAFRLEKSKSWAPATIVQVQGVLTKRCCAAKTVIVSSGFKKGGIISALKIKKTSQQQMAKLQKRQKEGTQRAMKIKALMKYNGQQPSNTLDSQQDVFPAAALSSSSLKTSDKSQLDVQRKAVRIMKNNEHMSLDEGSLLHKSVQRQRSLKAASRVHDDGSDVKMQPLFVSRETTEYRKRRQFELSAAQDDNKKEVSGKIITKQADFRSPEGESETEQLHTNTIENGNQKRLAYIQEADKADNNDVDHNQKLNEVGEEVLIMLFLPDVEMETKTEPLSEPKRIVNTDPGWKTVKTPIKQLDDPSPVTKVIKGNFIIELDNSKCNCLKESQFSSEIYAPSRTKAKDIKPAVRAVKVTTESPFTEKQVKETVKKTEDTGTNNTSHKNTSINHFKQEEPVIPSPPSVKMKETEPAKTTAANMEIKETTSSTEVFNRGSTQRADAPPSTETPTTTTRPQPETDTEPRFIKCLTNNSIRATTEKSFSGLRMRDDLAADTSKHHEGSEHKEGAATNRPGTKRTDENDPNVKTFTVAKPPTTIEKQATDQLPKTLDDNLPLCGGLIHRTEAGWKHCVERFAGMGSKMFSSREPTDAFQDKGEWGHTSPAEHKENFPNDDEYDHFYYFNGVMRRVQNNFYPYYKRQRRQKRSRDDTEDSVFTGTKTQDTPEILLRYIRRLAVRNKASRFQ